MSKLAHIKDALSGARRYSEGLFANFKTPDEWVYQVHDKANHALWCAGHLGSTDNFMLSLIAPEKAKSNERYKALFGGGSEPVGDASQYPSPDEIMDYLRERRKVLLEVLDGMTEADLAKPTPDDAPDFIPDIESAFRILSWHEGLHAGQASIAHRGLEKSPVMG